MLDLKDVFYFVQVVDRGGFTAAGATLRLPKSTLSHRVQELESYLGVRLINRTSRQFAMTDVGMEFYQHATVMLRNSEEAEEAVRQRLSESSGVVRITTTAEIAQFALRDLLPAFLMRYPRVQIVEIATDRLVDMVGEGFDLAIRGHISPLQDSTLIQRHIAKVPWFLFAGPGYLEQRGEPATPEALAGHTTMTVLRGGPLQWQLLDPDGKELIFPIAPQFQSNDMIAVKEATIANLGIAALPGYICKDELQSGKLRQILPGWIAADAKMSALMPSRTGILPAVRALVDFLTLELPKVTTFGH